MPEEIKNDPTLRKIMRGEIYYIYEKPVTGSEQRSGRPAIIVSNDICNATSQVVEVVYLTLRRKPPIPTHVIIHSGPCANSTVLCEQITSVDVSRIGDYMCRIPEDLEEALDNALKVSLSLSPAIKVDPKTASAYEAIEKASSEARDEIESLKQENTALKNENYQLRDKLRLTEDANGTLKQAPAGLAKQLKAAESERDLYKRMYDDLIDKLISRGVK